MTSLEGLQYFTELKTLNIENCKKIKNLDPINNLVNLEHLYIKNCDNIEDVSFLKKLENLKQFCLINSRNVKGNLSVLERFKKLESLCLNGCNLRDSDIRVLGNLKHLKEVYLGNNQITDISPLINSSQSIGKLCIQRNKIKNIDILVEMLKLKELDIHENNLTKQYKISVARLMKENKITLTKTYSSTLKKQFAIK